MPMEVVLGLGSNVLNDIDLRAEQSHDVFSTTIHAFDSTLDIPVSVRRFVGNQTSTEQAHTQFRIRACQWIHAQSRAGGHGGIQKIMRMGDDEHNNCVLICEDLGQQTLLRYVEGVESKQDLLSHAEILSLLDPLLSAVSHLHQDPDFLCHGSISPESILLRNGRLEEPVLAGFGPGRLLIPQNGENPDWRPNFSNDPNFAYLAPEIINSENDHINKRSDIYSLGSIMWRILTGHAPPSSSEREEALRTGQEDPVNLLALRQAVGRRYHGPQRSALLSHGYRRDPLALLNKLCRAIKARVGSTPYSKSFLAAVVSSMTLTNQIDRSVQLDGPMMTREPIIEN